MRSREGFYGLPGRPGAEKLADCRWSNTFSRRLAFFRALGGTFESDPGEFLAKPLGQLEGDVSLPLKPV